MKILCAVFIIFLSVNAFAQVQQSGTVSGIVKDAQGALLQNASIKLCKSSNTQNCLESISDKTGYFEINCSLSDYYSLIISNIGFATKQIDSIYVRADKPEIYLNEIILNSKSSTENEVIVYAEKPMIENKDGKIIFNVAESAAANGGSVNELLQKTPLVTIDADGKILLKGKEVKILIDDKPVELNAKQLQEMLESMPGSFIDKIEVMTNPPPQYANERGGVINIVSKKGKVGFTFRANLFYGTRGEKGVNAATTYKKNNLSTQFNAAISSNQYLGNGNYLRQNNYADSSNYLASISNFKNKSLRPNLRWNADYDFNKYNSLGLTINYNSNEADNNSANEFSNKNNNLLVYKINDRFISSLIKTNTINITGSYILKSSKQNGVFRLITGFTNNNSNNNRYFYQQFFGQNKIPLGIDSTQQQENYNRANNYSIRLSYDKSFKTAKYLLSTGLNYFDNNSYNILDAAYLKKSINAFIPQLGFGNEFFFRQQILQARVALKVKISTDFYAIGGLQIEHTNQGFNHITLANKFTKKYSSYLPSFLMNKRWANDLGISFSYKKTLQRPGINETNPALDIGDPYNTRFGNPYLLPFYAHNFDVSISKNNKKFNYNAGIGYNALNNLYVSIRTLQADGKTFITYQNITNRKEYEASVWGAYSVSKKLKISGSSGYSYNMYDTYGKQFLRYRNGGNFTSNINSIYTPKDVLQLSTAFTFNRFANPQGSVRSNISMSFNAQQKFFNKAIIITLSAVDPFTTQQNTSFTYGNNFTLQNYSFTQTKNFKITVGYNFLKKKKAVKKSTSKSIAPLKKGQK